MADVQSALRSRIMASTGHSRVHWTLVPQGEARPNVRLQTISDPRPQNLGGYEITRQTRVQADVFADSYREARALAELIIAAVAKPGTVAGVRFGRTKAEGPHDGGEHVEGVGYIHRLRTDLMVEHSPE